MRKRRSNNTWLFAFTDLSFLLLISLSLIPGANGDFSLRLAQLSLPAVPESRTLQPVVEPEGAWELRILPPTAGANKPFRLLHSETGEGIDCNEENLLPALENLRELAIKPVLLPDRTSLSQDFLFAAGALARVWSATETQVIVKPLPAGDNE